MKKIGIIITMLLLFPTFAMAVVLGEAPRNKVVAYKSLYTCTDGKWKRVKQQRTNSRQLSETQIGYKCIYSSSNKFQKKQ